LNATGKPTKNEVKKEVKKAVKVQKVTSQFISFLPLTFAQKQVKTNQLKASNSAKAASGLKISFRPAELSRTTDRNVHAQILGVLSKDPSYRNRGKVFNYLMIQF
jgi:hypothetical protein